MVARILILVFLVLTSVKTLPSQEVLHFEMVADFPPGIVYGEFAPGEPDRIYLTCLGGRVLIFDISTGQFVPEPFFQIDLSISGEGGLFSLVFHPDYQTNGRLFVCFTDSDNGNNVVVDEYRRTGPNRAERADQPVIVIERPPTTTPGHNGGWMDFGKDGYLYISVGEMNPVFENSQLIDDNLKGAILRIDVNGDDFPVSDKRNYAIPPDNPLVGLPGDDEILAYGIRNAWRCSFDSDGNLFVADLQGSLREEINVIPAGHQQALNFGWPFFEGTLECPLPFLCDDLRGSKLLLQFLNTSIVSGIVAVVGLLAVTCTRAAIDGCKGNTSTPIFVTASAFGHSHLTALWIQMISTETMLSIPEAGRLPVRFLTMPHLLPHLLCHFLRTSTRISISLIVMGEFSEWIRFDQLEISMEITR